MKMHASEHATRMAMMVLTMIALVACGKGEEKPQAGREMPPSMAIHHATATLPVVAGGFSDRDSSENDSEADEEVAVSGAVLSGSPEDLRAVATASRHYAIYTRYLAELNQDTQPVNMQQAVFVTGDSASPSSAFACQQPRQGM